MRTLIQELKQIEDRPLDFHEIQTILAGKCKNLHIKYTDLAALHNNYRLSDILPKQVNASLCLLTATLNSRVNRHWVSFMRHKNGKIDFYDPLHLGIHTLSSYMHDNGYFARFVSGIKADVNAKKHQRSAEMIKTCGLHSCCRLVAFATQDLTNNEYDHWISSVNMSPDLVVSCLTYIGHLSM